MSVAKPQNRDEFKQNIKTRLGAPVLEINVSDEQMDELQENLKALSCGGTKRVKQDVQFDMALQMLVSNFVKSDSTEVQ